MTSMGRSRTALVGRGGDWQPFLPSIDCDHQAWELSRHYYERFARCEWQRREAAVGPEINHDATDRSGRWVQNLELHNLRVHRRHDQDFLWGDVWVGDRRINRIGIILVAADVQRRSALAAICKSGGV